MKKEDLQDKKFSQTAMAISQESTKCSIRFGLYLSHCFLYMAISFCSTAKKTQWKQSCFLSWESYTLLFHFLSLIVQNIYLRSQKSYFQSFYYYPYAFMDFSF